jgi:peptidoglycan/xylan/chitin deacetylase (PgdA/CDA1 family)
MRHWVTFSILFYGETDTVDTKAKIKSILGHVAGASGLYTRSFRSKMTIVTFHRVTDAFPEDGLTCSSGKFAAFCEFFRTYFRVLPLSKQVAECRAGSDLGGTLSITFDDGYLNNFEEAAPILKRAGLPATFFVTTGFIGSQTIAPWDRALPRQPGWMNWDQVRALKSMGFEVGNHTATHLNMGVADSGRVRSELELSSATLNEELGQPSRLFAYPFGGRAHITAGALRLVQEAGFNCCVSSCGSLNAVTPDPFHLNRISIAAWFKTPHQFGYEYLAGKLDRDASYPGADQITIN